MNSTPDYAPCAPHDPSPRRPAMRLPAGAWDTHAHVCGPIQTYPLVANRLYNPPVASVTDYLHMLDTLGVERGVLVQPSVYGTDNRCMLDYVSRHPGRMRAVVAVGPDPDEKGLAALHDKGARGRKPVDDDKDWKLFALSFCAFFTAFYSFIF